MGAKTEGLQDDLEMETGFNDAINDLRKSLGRPEKAELNKSEAEEPEDEDEGEEGGEEGEGEEGEEGDEEGMKKSMSDRLREDPEAAAAMDVEPFLNQLAKSLDSAMATLGKRIAQVEKLTKSIGAATLANSELQKSTRDMVKSIGDQPLPAQGLKRLEKARFGTEEKEIDTRELLVKSRDWVKTGKMDLIEAGSLEGRINKGLVGRVNDRLDQKVAALLREDK